MQLLTVALASSLLAATLPPAQDSSFGDALGWSVRLEESGALAYTSGRGQLVERISPGPVRAEPDGGCTLLRGAQPGADARVCPRGASVEKSFVVRPGADPAAIRVGLEGAQSARLGERGELQVGVGGQRLSFSAPRAFQQVDGERREVEVRYALEGAGYRFAVGDYDRKLPLVIDPFLASTYLDLHASVASVAVDPVSGKLFVAGTWFDTETGMSAKEVWIARLSADLSAVEKRLRIPGGEGARVLATPAGIYVAGLTSSSQFPVPADAADPTLEQPASCPECPDAFVLRLDAELEIQAATFFGGSGGEAATGLLWDGASVFLVGSTNSADLPTTPGAFSRQLAGGAVEVPVWEDGFVAKLSADLKTLSAATYWGGPGPDTAPAALLAGGALYLTGVTHQAGLSVLPGAEPDTCEGDCYGTEAAGYLTRLAPDLGSARTVSLGKWIEPKALAATSDGALVVGATARFAWPSLAALRGFNPLHGGYYELLLLKVAGDLSVLQNGTYLGGRLAEEVQQLVASGGSLYAVAQTSSTRFLGLPLDGEHLQSDEADEPAILVARMSEDLEQLHAASAIGSRQDYARALAVAADGTLLVAGKTQSHAYPATPGAAVTAFPGTGLNLLAGFAMRLDGELGPDLALSSKQLDFGLVALGGQQEKPVEVTNRSLFPVDLASAEPTSAEYALAADACSSTRLAPGASCTLTVRFAPAGPWHRSGVLRLPYAIGGLQGLAEVRLTGQGGEAALPMNAGLAASPWPMLGADASLSGRAGANGPRWPRLLWSWKAPGQLGSPVVGADGTVYVTSGGPPEYFELGQLHAIGPDGLERWSTPLPDCPRLTSPAVARSGEIYVHTAGSGAATQQLVRVEPDGTQAWSIATLSSFGADLVSSPVIAPDGTVWFAAGDAGVRGIGREGLLRWLLAPGDSSIGTTVSFGPTGLLAVAESEGLHGFDLTGEHYGFLHSSLTLSGSPVQAADGTLYVPSASSLRAVEPGGRLRWAAALPSAAHGRPALGSDGTVYQLHATGLAAISPAGELLWESPACTGYCNSPGEECGALTLGADGTIYCRGQFLVALDSAGQERWRIEALAAPWAAGAAIGGEDVLLVPAGDELRAYGEASGPALGLEPASLSFGELSILQESELTVEVRLLVSIEAAEPTFRLTGSSAFSVRNSSLLVLPDRPGTLTVVFDPYEPGEATATLEVELGEQRFAVPISGTGARWQEPPVGPVEPDFPEPQPESSGCGCQGASGQAPWAALALLLPLLAGRRRRVSRLRPGSQS